MADSDIPTPWHRGEPVAIIGVIEAIVTVLASFIGGLTPERLAAINALIVALGAIIVRQNVSPV